MIPAAQLLSGNHKESFAFETISSRLPVILTKIINSLQQQSFGGTMDKSAVIKLVSGLKYAISRDFALQPSSLQPVKAEDTWFKAPWLLIECLMYQLLNDFVVDNSSGNAPDLFQHFKKEATLKALPKISQINSELEHIKEAQDGLHKMIQVSLWGNQADLSLSFDSFASDNGTIIVDDSAKFMPILRKAKVVTIIMDNAGLELYADLCLAEYLLTKCDCVKVIFEVKAIPWFISDTIITDFDILFDLLSGESAALKEQTDRWREYLSAQKWIIRSNPYWTTCVPYWTLIEQKGLFAQLCHSDFLIFKGDLNYRKMVHDASWPTDTPLSAAIGPLFDSGLPPFVMLRTCKSDTCCGLEAGQHEKLESIDKRWMVNGQFGMIQSY